MSAEKCELGKEKVSRREFTFALQWHVTAKCDQKCKHCYMYDSPFYKSEVKNELSFEECKSIIDDYVQTINRWKVKGTIFFSGGDPLLRKDFFEILKYTQNKGVNQIGVMGNSYHLDELTAQKLKECGVSAYQISLDGLKDTHDFFRKPGSFADSLRGYQVLKEAGIHTACMYTVSKINMNELIDVIRLAADIELAAFDFDRLVPVGSGEKLKDDMIEPNAYKELLGMVNEEYKRLEAAGCKTEFGRKDNLWWLFYKERGEIDTPQPLPHGCEVHNGCLIGWQGLSILSDGSVMACRRLPIIIGKLPKQKISEVFIESTKLNELRDIKKIEKCCECENLPYCRGCRAIAYGSSNSNYFAKDPQCWL